MILYESLLDLPPILFSDIISINSLLKQLPLTEEGREKVRVLDKDVLGRMLGTPGFTMIVAQDDEKDLKIVGMASVGIMDFPIGKKAFIEDVVVDKNYSGQGIGKKLMQWLIQIAKDAGAKSVELTSNPARVVANQLYEKLGFKKRETKWVLNLRNGVK